MFFLLLMAILGIVSTIILFIQESNLIYLLFCFLFCVIAIIIYRLYINRKVVFWGELTSDELIAIHEKNKLEFGDFRYFDDGFEFADYPRILWNEINEVKAIYSVTAIENIIAIQIYYNNNVFSANENTNGWRQFLNKLEKSIPIENFYIQLLGLYGSDSSSEMGLWKREEIS